MVEILVRGEAVERAAAERATVTVHSRWQAASPEDAMAEVADAQRRVADGARELAAAGAVESWHADRVWVSHHREWVGEGQPQRLVFTAAAAVTATFVDVDALGGWIGSLGTAPVHEIGGIAWSLAEATERELAARARARAVADAVERAADYARAAGLGAPRIAAIREPDLSAARPLVSKHRASEAVLMGGADTGASLELAAGQIEVVAVVEAAFKADAVRAGD